MRKSYPSDISREQFEKIREELESIQKKTHPRKYDLYDIFCAVLYLLKEGCTWRAIPHDYPNWQNVRYHYDIWSKPNAEVEVVKRNELHTFEVLPKRWIVERSFGWLDKYRRLWKNCERLLQNSFQMVSLAFIRIILNRY